ncbi:testis-expressed protein 36-like isoform X2 [Lineus longissimus]|uniref:testis-expressed protein 36-like isoform X2 n=1 Tax=Lineus longissimus TaxID=88925 RepID=UPI002B4D67D6
MPKGRQHAPSTADIGNWYEHRGLPHVYYNTPARVPGTTTGTMLASPYVPQSYPFPPPRPYMEKDSKSFKSQNSFSVHNNRNIIQDCGEYFGDGKDSRFLGKMNKDPYHRQHFTGSAYLSHEGEEGNPYNFKTMYRASYFGDQETERPTLRRFPKVYSAGTEGTKKLDTSTTDWYNEPDVPHKTSLQVLASTQEPHLKRNRWKYSNHGLPRICPSYSVSYKEPAVKIF